MFVCLFFVCLHILPCRKFAVFHVYMCTLPRNYGFKRNTRKLKLKLNKKKAPSDTCVIVITFVRNQEHSVPWTRLEIPGRTQTSEAFFSCAFQGFTRMKFVLQLFAIKCSFHSSGGELIMHKHTYIRRNSSKHKL